jgi:hypothetical protein
MRSCADKCAGCSGYGPVIVCWPKNVPATAVPADPKQDQLFPACCHNIEVHPSWRTELAFHGIYTSRRTKAESVTHVSGTFCHLCLGPLKTSNDLQSRERTFLATRL